jgi:hypothetical protein
MNSNNHLNDNNNNATASHAVPFYSGGVVEPVSSVSIDGATTVDASSHSSSLPLECMIYLPVGSCILHTRLNNTQHAAGVIRPPSPPTLRVDKLGPLLVSLQGHLCSSISKRQCMRVLGYRLLVERGQFCTAVLLVDDAILYKRAEQAVRLASLTSLHPLSNDIQLQSSIARAHVASELSSLHIQLRNIVTLAEQQSSLGERIHPLQRLNKEHEFLIDELVRNDGIKQLHANERRTAGGGTNALLDPLTNTHTLPEFIGLENYVRLVLSRGDLRQRWLFSHLFPHARGTTGVNVNASESSSVLPARSMVLSAYLLSPNADEVLLSHIEMQWASWNLAAPTNPGIWRIIMAYAKALIERQPQQSSKLAAPSQCVAISFPLSSPPLIVYLAPVHLLTAADPPSCLVVVEIGPTASCPPSTYSSSHHGGGGMLPRAPFILTSTSAPGELQWIDPEASLMQLSLSNAAEVNDSIDELLPASHPLLIEAQRYHPRPFSLIHSIQQLPIWHSGRLALVKEAEADADAAFKQMTVWERVLATVQLIQNDSIPPSHTKIATRVVIAGAAETILLSPLGSDLSSPLSVITTDGGNDGLLSPPSSLFPSTSPPASSIDTIISPVTAIPTTSTAARLVEDTADIMAQPLSPVLPIDHVQSAISNKGFIEEEEEKINTTQLLDIVSIASSPPPKQQQKMNGFMQFKPLPPATPPMPHPPAHHTITDIGAGTASFRRRKLHAPAGAPPLPPAPPAASIASLSTGGNVRSHPYAAIHSNLDYPATPLTKQVPLELTLDTPRLHTIQMMDNNQNTPRIIYNPTTKRASGRHSGVGPISSSSFLPPIDPRDTSTTTTTTNETTGDLLSKLQMVADEDHAGF